ncbi:hypothetical protein U0C82_05050 [Fulvimarina sp. 2208YS6-2-32]|uniref:Lipoprotein n=1 Tax=Fulvimarina uroteuthidis TaxID=3098149 RepID=A0ABU5I0D0_9HYPH|nr:hypothetical protein [Fulvimarina sp. 2208YS6-2-32]MDY8108520.1 hypothetical protein [Fulvimarina sp. 2208YS6-2-32]
MIQGKPPTKLTRPTRAPHLSLGAALLAAFLAACSSTGSGDGLDETAASLEPAPQQAAATDFASLGEPAPYCPKVEVREGTGIIDKRAGQQSAYNANIIGAQSTCRVVAGQLRMKVEVAGRVAPGPAAPGTVELPLRIAILRGDDVIYSELGRASARAVAGGEAQNFSYVDDRIAFAVPSDQNITVFTGFDEGPPQ